MSFPVHLVDSLAEVSNGSVVEVDGDEAHHAVAVRRLGVGADVVLTDGCGRSAIGRVAKTGKRYLAVTVSELRVVEPATPSITVVQAIPKGERGELAVEVLTEVGVDTIVPWSAARCVAVWRGPRAIRSHTKWCSTAREAAKQSRRSWFPQVDLMASTAEVLDRLAQADLAVVLQEGAATSMASLEVPTSGRIVVVVGPEGGISPEELAAFEDAGVVPVRLGSEVLRTSTAGVAAVSALLARTARWS